MILPIHPIELYGEGDRYLFISADKFYKTIFLVSMTFIICCVRAKLKYS